MNNNNTVDSILLTLGTAFSLSNIESVLGIIILVIQVIWIGFKLIYSVKDKLKSNKPIDDLDIDVNEIINKASDIKDIIAKHSEDKDDTSK